MASRSFLLTHTFKDISKLEEGGSYYSDIDVRHDIPWKIRIFKKEEFLGVNLHCENEECFETKKWSFQTKFTMKLVAVGGKFFQRTVQHEFQKPGGHGMDKYISWENMQRDYVDTDIIIIEIHANIVSSIGFFEVEYLPIAQQDSDNSFLLKHTFKNISRLVEDERDYSDTEKHYNALCDQKPSQATPPLNTPDPPLGSRIPETSQHPPFPSFSESRHELLL